MKCKNGKALSTWVGLREVVNYADEKFTAKLAYKLAKLFKVLTEEVKVIQESENKLIKRLIEDAKKRDPEGKIDALKAGMPEFETYQKERDELYDAECDIAFDEKISIPPECTKFKASWFVDCDMWLETLEGKK